MEIKHLLLILPLFAFGCNSKPIKDQQPVNHKAPDDLSTESSRYEIINKNMAGSYANYNILVLPPNEEQADIMVVAKIVQTLECGDTPCSVITMWNSRAGYDLYVNKKNNYAWRKKHWTTMCESNIADYVVSVGELVFSPMIDDQYREYGGKKKRFTPSSIGL